MLWTICTYIATAWFATHFARGIVEGMPYHVKRRYLVHPVTRKLLKQD